MNNSFGQVIISIGMLTCLSAHAGDFASAIPVPSPVGSLSGSLIVNQVELRINGQDASIQFNIKNTLAERAFGNLTIYGPLFTWGGTDAAYNDKQFPDLQVWSEKKSIALTAHTSSYHNGAEITKTLKTLRLAPLLVARRGEAIITPHKYNARLFESAARAGLLAKDDGTYTPNWYTQASHTWPVSIKAASNAKVTIKYKLRPAYKPLKIDDRKLLTLLSEHCANADQLAQHLSKNGQSLPNYVVALTYKIPIGFGSAPTPDEIQLDFIQDKSWSGLMPAVSYACAANGANEGVFGAPSMHKHINLIDGVASILMILPQ